MTKNIHIIFEVLNFIKDLPPEITLTTLDKLIMVILSSHKGRKGIYPSMSTLSKQCGVVKRQVIRRINYLSEINLIKVEKTLGSSNRYIVTLPTPTSDLGVTSDLYVTGDLGVTGVVTFTTPTSDLGVTLYNKITNKINNNTIVLSDRFEEFWLHYPRKENKKKTEAVWNKNKLNEIAEIIIEDIKKRTHEIYSQRDRAYIPHATTYLNGERWKDEIISQLRSTNENISRTGHSSRAETPMERMSRKYSQQIRDAQQRNSIDITPDESDTEVD